MGAQVRARDQQPMDAPTSRPFSRRRTMRGMVRNPGPRLDRPDDRPLVTAQDRRLRARDAHERPPRPVRMATRHARVRPIRSRPHAGARGPQGHLRPLQGEMGRRRLRARPQAALYDGAPHRHSRAARVRHPSRRVDGGTPPSGTDGLLPRPIDRSPQGRMDGIIRRRHLRAARQLQLGGRKRERPAQHAGDGRLTQERRPAPRPLRPLQVRSTQHRVGRTRHVVPVRRPEPAQLRMALAPMGGDVPLPNQRTGAMARVLAHRRRPPLHGQSG